MIRAWNYLIEPMIRQIEAKTILEVGSEVGFSTRALLAYVKAERGHLHTIDPKPSFDVWELQKVNRDFITHYNDLSLKALPDIPPYDVALIDGDHNWYTVFNELLLIENKHCKENLPQPLIFLHDTDWPYGRRDLYYNPETIPSEFRHPHDSAGIVYGKTKLVTGRGMNQGLCNAVFEGGKCNGVMTAIEDFVAASSLEWLTVHIPLYFGVTILVTNDRLNSHPSLKISLSKLQDELTNTDLIRFGEQLRISEGISFQKLHRENESLKKDLERALIEIEALRKVTS